MRVSSSFSRVDIASSMLLSLKKISYVSTKTSAVCQPFCMYNGLTLSDHFIPAMRGNCPGIFSQNPLMPVWSAREVHVRFLGTYLRMYSIDTPVGSFCILLDYVLTHCLNVEYLPTNAQHAIRSKDHMPFLFTPARSIQVITPACLPAQATAY